MAGKLIVFEGTDGSGKSTQFARLCKRVSAMGRDYQKLTFPQYKEPSSALIRMYQEQGRMPEAADMMLQAYENTDTDSFRLERSD